ncbi:MAG: DCC1-like thiol-disulfide oxidoreductase family protein [Candidatus Marinimicrobia bacterium]|nr:DCC1-like thiol-disulfide oxidoreductase family protein [Candidatus Neomarinimicrobiota bacterium]
MNSYEKRPLLIYDGECQYCIKWANKFETFTSHLVTYVPLQKIPLNYKYITRAACLQSVHFININDRVSKGAEAIFQLFYTAKKARLLFILYKWFPPFRFTSELVYKWISKNRHLLS